MPSTSNRAVLVHTCKYGHADMDNNGGALVCTCKEHITVRMANDLVAAGVAVFKRAPLGAVDNRQILKTGRQTQPPRAATISAARWWENIGHEAKSPDGPSSSVRMRGNIERAYVAGDAREAERIEVYGQMTRDSWRSVGAPTGKVNGTTTTT